MFKVRFLVAGFTRRSGAWLAAICVLVIASPLARGQTTDFRFAFLSDVHIGSSNAEADLRATVRDINSTTGLSFVVITGDITEYGSREQFRLAKELLDELRIPCHVVPGNHDCKWSESGATDFARYWNQDRFVFEHCGFRFIAMHEGPVMKMGDGHWAPQDVRWLAEELNKMPDQNQPVIFVTHYPLDDGIDNWYVVLDLLKKYNTQLVLCGHGHANHHYVFEGLPGVMGRSNLRARQAIGGYNLVEFKDGLMTFAERAPGQKTKTPWHSVRLEKHDFAGDTNKYPRPGFSVNGRYPGVKEAWVYDTGYLIASSPAVWKELAIVGDACGTVHGLQLKDGRPRWKFHTQDAVYSTPAISGDSAVVASTDGTIYALNAAIGKELWRLKTERPIVASPAIAEGKVFIGSSEGKFRALDVNSGKPVWEFEPVAGFVETRALLYNGKVIFGAWGQNLYALDAATGKLAWKWQGDRAGTLYSPAACWPIAADGKVFIVAPDRKMTAINASTGEQIWRTGDYVVRESIGLSEDSSRFYVRAMDDFFYAFSTKAAQPTKLWELNAHFGYDINSAMLAEKDGVVFYGTKNGLVLALDAKTGAIQWQHKLGVSIVNTLVPLDGHNVLAADFDGKVILLTSRQ